MKNVGPVLVLVLLSCVALMGGSSETNYQPIMGCVTPGGYQVHEATAGAGEHRLSITSFSGGPIGVYVMQSGKVIARREGGGAAVEFGFITNSQAPMTIVVKNCGPYLAYYEGVILETGR